MHVETYKNRDGKSNVEAEIETLTRQVSWQRIIQERSKRIQEFKNLGLSQRRVVTNLANEMRLRLHFLGVPLEHFKRKKAWSDMRLLRDICNCAQKMLKVFVETKLMKEYVSINPQRFGLVSLTESILEEISYASFVIHSMCDTMSAPNLCLLYRVCLYVVPKLKIIGQPTLEDEMILRDFIDMQHR